MRVLVTGSTGMVGRNLIEHPRASAFSVLAPRRNELDLADFRATRDYLLRESPDLVIHAAGRVGGIGANLAAPVEFLVDNLDMGRNLIMAARDASVPRLINLGSSCMYPRDAPGRLREDQILSGELEPTNEGYALAKIAVARLCDYVSRTSPDLRYKTVIPCNLYGRYDKFDPLHAHLVPAAVAKIHTARTRGGAVEIWGDGSARREFMYAADLADFLWTAVERFEDLPQVMNVGPGEDRTVREYYLAAAEAVNWRGEFRYDASRAVGMRRKVVDTTRLAKFGWSPRYTIEQGLREIYEYMLSLPPYDVAVIEEKWSADSKGN